MAGHDPTMIDCEGVGCPPTAEFVPDGNGMCSMCGGWHPLDDDGLIEDHQRRDILADLARGDFG